MIRYNFPHRGPLEYEKFVLNYLQLSNEVSYLVEVAKESKINQYKDEVNYMFHKELDETGTETFRDFL